VAVKREYPKNPPKNLPRNPPRREQENPANNFS
jgi:hypothetical protein